MNQPVLHLILGALEIPGVEQLRDQVRMLHVAPGSDATCRIYAVHPSTPRAGVSSDARTRLEPLVVRSPQGRIVGELAIWVEPGAPVTT